MLYPLSLMSQAPPPPPNPPPYVTPKRKARSNPQDEPNIPRKNLKAFPKEDTTDDGPLPMSGQPDVECEKLTKKLAATRSKLYRKSKLLQSTNKRRGKNIMMEELEKRLPQRTFQFIWKQLNLFKKKKFGRRWTEKDKTLAALSLYHASSRKAYRLLKKLFILPSVSTLRKTMRDVELYPGLNDRIVQTLAQKVEALGAGAEVCSLVFDEMSIKEWVDYNKEHDNIEGLEDFGISKYTANHVTVFIVRG